MQLQMIHDNQSGFIALTSAVVITALLIVVTIALSYSGFFARFNVLDTEFKKESVGYAEACVEKARIMIANNVSSYPPTINIDSDNPGDECTLTVTGTAPYVIHAQVVYKNSYTNVQADATRSASNVTVANWKEVPNF